MPTMPERMSVVETKVEFIEQTVSGMDTKLDEVLTYIDEERGARNERAASGGKKFYGIVGVIAALIAAGIDAGLKVLGVKI